MIGPCAGPFFMAHMSGCTLMPPPTMCWIAFRDLFGQAPRSIGQRVDDGIGPLKFPLHFLSTSKISFTPQMQEIFWRVCVLKGVMEETVGASFCLFIGVFCPSIVCRCELTWPAMWWRTERKERCLLEEEEGGLRQVGPQCKEESETTTKVVTTSIASIITATTNPIVVEATSECVIVERCDVECPEAPILVCLDHELDDVIDVEAEIAVAPIGLDVELVEVEVPDPSSYSNRSNQNQRVWGG
jgi:hypothetical protein